MSCPDSRQRIIDGGCRLIANIFKAYEKDIPPTNILEEIYGKLNQVYLLSEIREIYLSYGIDMTPKFEKDVPFINLYDVIRQALSRSDKKAETFCMGILQHMDYSLAECQALISAPTCQLAQQIAEVMRNLGDKVGIKVHALVGGEKHNLREGGFHVIVGTPGRMCCILNRKLLQPDHIKMFVLYEADEMLTLGLKNQIKEIFRFLPKKAQLTSFSFTLHPEALKIARKLMLKPVSIFTKSDEVVGWEEVGIKKFYVNIPEDRVLKFAALCHICETLDVGRCVIYANTTPAVLQVSSMMTARGYKVSGACTGMEEFAEQEYIDAVMEEFTSGSSNVLVTMPDFVVRAIDLQQVSLVINYDMSPPFDNNLHLWNGGRFGRDGVIIDLISMNDEEAADDLIHGFCNVVTIEGEGLRY